MTVTIQVYVLTEAAIAPPQQGIALNHIFFVVLCCIDNNNIRMIIIMILPLLIIDINENCRPPVLGGEMRCEGEHRTPAGGDTVSHVTEHLQEVTLYLMSLNTCRR